MKTVLVKITSEYMKKPGKKVNPKVQKSKMLKIESSWYVKRRDQSLAVRERIQKARPTNLFLEVREPMNLSRGFGIQPSRERPEAILGLEKAIGVKRLELCFQGSPPYSAFPEPERELHELTRGIRECLKAFCSNQVRSTSPIPFPIMSDVDPPARRTVHQRASDGVTGARSSITRPAIPNTNRWQIPSHVLSTITHATQFHGLEDEDAPGHLSCYFTHICDTFNITGVSKDAIYLRLFPFSLSRRSSTWLDTLPDNSITTWEDLQAKFFKKYYPPSRAARLQDQIHSFQMDTDEPYHMAWECSTRC
ncbi:hypothetical protein L1987_06950 [Smallanthus sonchifolius]|uniref:Uncharacterized protein n=1 Tax=Smallanthus sonchifolius TaxID=185202 RepID=A0ACB9JZQ7_9ASTR|nr:hypothetical protein L1987_06950 [Smallanthus sonchifolius]